jgi:hypothetical protein
MHQNLDTVSRVSSGSRSNASVDLIVRSAVDDGHIPFVVALAGG